jgi:RNA polymerase sigma-70 factor (ECF subfamily)
VRGWLWILTFELLAPSDVSDARQTQGRGFVTPPSASESLDDDAYLISKSLSGEREASDVLLSRYRQFLYRLAYGVLRNHEDCEDAVQNFLAFSKLMAFKHEGAFRSWLARILFNEAVSILRQRKHQVSNSSQRNFSERPAAMLDGLSALGPDPERAFAQREAAAALVRKVSELCPLQRSALVLCGIRECTAEEASAILKVSSNAVRTRLFRAKKRLAVLLGSDESIARIPRTF